MIFIHLRKRKMIAMIYRFKLKPEQEQVYQDCWNKIVHYFKQHCGALGSCLHKSEDGLWVAYSRWPDQATKDAAWPGENEPNHSLPPDIKAAIKKMQTIKTQNQDLPQYDDLCLDVVTDLLLH